MENMSALKETRRRTDLSMKLPEPLAGTSASRINEPEKTAAIADAWL